MITLQMTLWPYGDRARESPLLIGRIWTTSGANGAPAHRYRINDADGHVVAKGEVAKTRSGHRNPLHLLESVLESIDLDALPRNYVTTRWDLEPGDPVSAAWAHARITETIAVLVDQSHRLAAAGHAGRAALEAAAVALGDQLRNIDSANEPIAAVSFLSTSPAEEHAASDMPGQNDGDNKAPPESLAETIHVELQQATVRLDEMLAVLNVTLAEFDCLRRLRYDSGHPSAAHDAGRARPKA